MFNLGKVLAFCRKLLKVLAPILAVTLFLSFLTEWFTREAPASDLLSSWQFWLAVSLNILPVLVVMGIVLRMASRFVNQVFKTDDRKRATSFLLYHRFGQPSFSPWMKVDQAEIMGDEGLKCIGGPGNLVIYLDSAVVMEKGGKLTKVDGRGFPSLDAFEKIYNVIDLRPKQYTYNVSAMSKEGIPISWDVEIRYRIDDGGKTPTNDEPYPFSKDAVLKAATCEWRREPGFRFGQDMDWEGRVVVSETEGSLRSILARRPLDQLIGITAAEEQAIRESIQSELERELRKSVPKLGAKILGVKLDNLQVEDQITQQLIKNWKAYWESWSVSQVAPSEAYYIKMYEIEKARIQIAFINDLARGIQKLLDNNILSPQAINRIIRTRLFSMIDRVDYYTSARIFPPGPTTDMVDRMMALPSGDPVIVQVKADPDRIPPDSTSNISVKVSDQDGNSVVDGTNVIFKIYPSDSGTIMPPTTQTISGSANAIFIAGSKPSKVHINAQCGTGSNTTMVEIV